MVILVDPIESLLLVISAMKTFHTDHLKVDVTKPSVGFGT